MDCIFCKIAKGGVPAEKVFEDDSFIAFADVNLVSEGHTLIVSKKHFNTLMDLDEETSRQYISAIKEVGKILMKKYDADGFNLLLNNGKIAGQVVEHVHFHIIPRKKGDGIKDRLYFK